MLVVFFQTDIHGKDPEIVGIVKYDIRLDLLSHVEKWNSQCHKSRKADYAEQHELSEIY